MLFLLFTYAIFKKQVSPRTNTVLIVYCSMQVLFIAEQLCCLLLCLISPCIIAGVLCVVFCCPRAISAIEPDIEEDAPAVPLEVVVYTPTLRLEADPECRICFQSFNLGDRIVQLPCNAKHAFHEFCINSWFAVSRTCPMCRVHIR